MESIELFKKCGYKKRYEDNSCIIYDFKKEQSQYYLPETIIIEKNNFSIELTTENAEKNIHLGAFSFEISNELFIAINKKIEELKKCTKKET